MSLLNSNVPAPEPLPEDPSLNLRLLFMIGSLELGGAESQMVLLIKRLVERGVHCEVFVLMASGVLKAELESIGVRIHDGGFAPGAGVTGYLFALQRSFWRAIRVIWRFRPDIIHAFLPLTNFLAAVTGRFSGRKNIITSRRALGNYQDSHFIWKHFDRIANVLSRSITVNSKAVWHDVITREKVNEEKLVLIYNGIDAARFAQARKRRAGMRSALGLQQDEFAIVMIANLIPYKGHLDAISAIAIANGKHPYIRLLVVGEDRGIQKDLEEAALNTGIQEKVRFLGRRDNIPDLLGAADVALVASYEEGFSNALLEAMAAGLAVIATDVGGNSEALEAGRLGCLVPPRAPDKIAEAIIALIENPQQRKAYGINAAKAVARKYTVETMVCKYLNLYQAMVGQDGHVERRRETRD